MINGIDSLRQSLGRLVHPAKVCSFLQLRQAVAFRYPLLILRLSLAAYRLGRVVVVGGICTEIVWARRGIVAGAGHATIERRVILLQCADETTRLYQPLVTLQLYVDNHSGGSRAQVGSQAGSPGRNQTLCSVC